MTPHPLEQLTRNIDEESKISQKKRKKAISLERNRLISMIPREIRNDKNNLGNYLKQVLRFEVYAEDTQMLQLFGDQYSQSSDEESWDGFLLYLHVNKFWDEVMIEIYNKIDKNQFINQIQGLQDGVNKLNAVFGEYKTGSISQQSYEQLALYHADLSDTIGFFTPRIVSLEGRMLDLVQGRVEASKSAMEPMERGLKWGEILIK